MGALLLFTADVYYQHAHSVNLRREATRSLWTFHTSTKCGHVFIREEMEQIHADIKSTITPPGSPRFQVIWFC